MTADELARQRIRMSLDENLIVEAAAGTGKTTELVHRIVNTIRTGRAAVHRIVAVTFTRKAAGELRLRLRLELDAARRATQSPDEIRYLEHALARLEEAHIGTIHAFCAELLRQRPVEARIPPGFVELDEPQSLRLYARAFDHWIQDALQRMPEGLRRALNRVSQGNSSEDDSPLEQIRNAGWMLVQWRDFTHPWQRKAFDRQAEIGRILPQIIELAAMADTCKIANHPVRVHLRCVTDFVSRMRRSEAMRPRDYDELEALLNQLARSLRRYHQKGYGKKYSAEFSRDEVLAAKDLLQSTLDQFQRWSEADLAAVLHSEFQSLVEKYEELKARSGKLDFVDLLIRTRELLRENAGVRRFMQEEFTHIYVDELQDTDPVQAEILVLLAADNPDQTDWRAVRPKPGKLFLVGDPKQSIYRFRRADIILYQELCRQLQDKGVAIEYLSRSFRAVKPIQDAVNAAFAPEMTRNLETGQPDYVPLTNESAGSDNSPPESGGVPSEARRGGSQTAHLQGFPFQPSLIVIPAPYPYGWQRLSDVAISKCLPDAIAGYIDWLLRESQWKVRDTVSQQPVAIESYHIAILFRRFMSWGADVTRDYVHALEARQIPHLLWGARSFHQREEIETVRAALNAVERPDDELCVYGTLRGALFAISDNLLLRYRDRVGSFHPFRPVPDNIESDFSPVVEAMRVIADLHRRRNRRSIVETVNSLLEAARAHAVFALRPSGNQVLANVYRICDLARSYEQGDGYSFRGFVEQLNAQAEREDSAEAPVLEEGTEGVRVMTVHSAKGLEFPVVILADMTAKIASSNPDKFIDLNKRLCAIRLMGCAPWDLMDHEQQEHARDVAEGIRVAYVAATRARDLLVVPGVGDEPREGWLNPLNKAIYPERSQYRSAMPVPLCPKFGDATVLRRPVDFDGTEERSVKPGLHNPERGTHSVVWWDPASLRLQVDVSFGLRQEGILAEDKAGQAEQSLQDYNQWRAARQQAGEQGQVPSLNVVVATNAAEPPQYYSNRVQVETVAREGPRPRGARFGSLVHLIFRDVEFTPAQEAIARLAQTHGRLLNATAEEIDAATYAVAGALLHPLLERARHSSRIHRELPIVVHDNGTILEAVIDLTFIDNGSWVVVDFKTDAEDGTRLMKYRRQVACYMQALETATQTTASSGWILQV